jgi:hypothetical protein
MDHSHCMKDLSRVLVGSLLYSNRDYWLLDQWRRDGGQGGQLPPGARGRGRQKRVVAAKEEATNMTNKTFAPGCQKPWRRHCAR